MKNINRKSENRSVGRSLHRLVFGAVFSAVIAVATMVITVPLPMGGFANLGDGLILLAAWLLGPWYGFAAGAIGSALADLLLGYAAYVPGTFVIKGLIGLLGGLLYRVFLRLLRQKYVSAVLSAVIAEAEMVFGYFLYGALALGEGMAALSAVPGNVGQGAVGVILFVLCFVFLGRSRAALFFTDSARQK